MRIPNTWSHTRSKLFFSFSIQTYSFSGKWQQRWQMWSNSNLFQARLPASFLQSNWVMKGRSHHDMKTWKADDTSWIFLQASLSICNFKPQTFCILWELLYHSISPMYTRAHWWTASCIAYCSVDNSKMAEMLLTFKSRLRMSMHMW